MTNKSMTNKESYKIILNSLQFLNFQVHVVVGIP